MKKMKLNNTEKVISDQIFASCSFDSLGLHPNLCDQLQKSMGFKVPTLVQSEAIPVILSGRHVLINAATGTGKTIAYLAPIVHCLQGSNPRINRSNGTFALVIVPTHELCIQIYDILQKLLHYFHWIVPGYVMGGEKRSKEKARLRKGISILVATPGRLLDHLKNTLSFLHENLHWIIFDEADMILELGFDKEIEEILDILGSRKNAHNKESAFPNISKFQRQNLLLSATLNEKVNHLAKISLENPVMIGLDDKKPQANPLHENLGSMTFGADAESQVVEENFSSSTREYKLPTHLVQRYAKVCCGSRLVILLSILKNYFENEACKKIVVFFSTCDAVNFHYSLISEFVWPFISDPDVEDRKKLVRCKTFRLHGNLSNEDRKSAFQNFNSHKQALLLCTDVAARGLDFPKVKCIIQYDSPGEATEYVHRVGRTARLGETGDSLLFLQPVEMDYLKDLEKHGVLLKEFPVLKVLNGFPLHDGRRHFKKLISLEMHPWVLSLQTALESFITAEAKMLKMAKAAFCSWVRAYTAHRGDLKAIFMVRKLHLGHVAKSFGLKQQPSLVGKSLQLQHRKRKMEEKKHKTRQSKKPKPK